MSNPVQGKSDSAAQTGLPPLSPPSQREAGLYARTTVRNRSTVALSVDIAADGNRP